MSGLTNFLAPYSNLIFSHRNTIIVVLGIILGCTALYALYGHWRVQRLERDVQAARSGAGRQPMPRPYASVQPAMEERPADAAGLPPVKGGRTYARNLGSALQKAGMGPGQSGQPIYSPPIPQGWAPNTAASQPITPSSPPLYSPASSTWGAPTPSTSWPAYPQPAQGTGRPGVNQPLPPQVPMYQPPAPGSQPPQPPTYYPPAYPAGPQAAPSMGQAPGAFAPPAIPMTPPPVPAIQPEASPQDAGRRAKGKRRRFNLSVLESLEKIVQPRQAPQPSQPQPGAVAPAQPTTVPAPPTATPAPAMPTPMPPHPAWGTTGKPAAPPAPEPAVVPPPASTQEPASVEAPSLSLNFEPPPSSPSAVEPAAESKAEPKPDARQSMRSMLFGEEPSTPARAGDAEETSAAAATEPAESSLEAAEIESPVTEIEPTPAAASEPVPSNEPVATEYSWQTAYSAPDLHEATAEGHDAAAETYEPVAESHEPASESHESVDERERERPTTPWEPLAWSSETSTVDEGSAPVETPPAEEHPAASVTAESPGDASGEPPASSDGNGSAGTMVIIEDDHTVAQYYATLFQGNGYRVEVANDGVSGVDLCTRVQPQVILLDVMMPRQNGILVLQTLRASDETRNTPVVVMSNFSEPTLIKRALQLGALEYVIKTQVEGPALLAAVPRWINREKAFAA